MSNPSSSPATSSGANYFFGFLITFVALIIFFVGCGIGSRRLVRARRLANATTRPTDPAAPLGGSQQPVLYDACVVPLGFPAGLEMKQCEGANNAWWSRMQPLSLSRQYVEDPQVAQVTVLIALPSRQEYVFGVSAARLLPPDWVGGEQTHKS